LSFAGELHRCPGPLPDPHLVLGVATSSVLCKLSCTVPRSSLSSVFSRRGTSGVSQGSRLPVLSPLRPLSFAWECSLCPSLSPSALLFSNVVCNGDDQRQEASMLHQYSMWTLYIRAVCPFLRRHDPLCCQPGNGVSFKGLQATVITGAIGAPSIETEYCVSNNSSSELYQIESEYESLSETGGDIIKSMTSSSSKLSSLQAEPRTNILSERCLQDIVQIDFLRGVPSPSGSFLKASAGRPN
jgi:hypothetical protein